MTKEELDYTIGDVVVGIVRGWDDMSGGPVLESGQRVAGFVDGGVLTDKWFRRPIRDVAKLDANTIRLLAIWAEQEIEKGGEIGHYYWGYDGVPGQLRNLADRVDAHGSFDRESNDRDINDFPEQGR